jgi:hypothetical protein
MAVQGMITESFRRQAGACRFFDSPFTAALLDGAATSLETGGILADLIGQWPGNPYFDALAIRLAGVLHRAMLSGMDPALAAAYPGPAGPGDGSAAWAAAENFIANHRDWVIERLASPPQTNEVRRSAGLLAGLLVLAAEHKLPFALLEPGASAGLNLNLDVFRYRNDVWSWNDPDAAGGDDVVIETKWTGTAPPLGPLEIAERAGCDQNPVDITQAEDRLRLASYVWADQPERVARLNRAVALALRRGTRVEQEDAALWLERKLAARRPGHLTVIYHSVFLQYPPAATRQRITAAIETAGSIATITQPLAWLRFEPEAVLGGSAANLRCLLDLITWPGGERRVLAEVDPHGRSVVWY